MMRFLGALAVWCCMVSSWAQTLELDGVKVTVRQDLQVQPFVAGVSELARIGGVSIVPKGGGSRKTAGQKTSLYLSVGQDTTTGKLGLISREISFKVRQGAARPGLPAGVVVKPLVGKDIFWVEVQTVQELLSVLNTLRASPAIEWTQSSFITDESRPP